MGRKIITTVYITEEQDRALKELNGKSKVPVAQFIREGIDLVLEKHNIASYGQLSFDAILKRKQKKEE
ncbi:MAG: ribbon-helix-helix domain-containing protein [Pseudomonadota bacterium]